MILGKGCHLNVDNVLFVPSAPLRLLSVLLINRGSSYTSHFDSTCCWLTNATGSTVASSYITSHDLYALSTSDISTSHDYSTHVATTAQADLDTLHYRLGHTNYETVIDMFRSGAVEGMPINLSRMPAKCQPCILGKQVRNSFPKVREGVRATR